ncbi:MAG: hypothetical protein K2O44_06920 [Clostridia bacterium]|nr:hypothetical protein [Clostridia bacterium]
MNKIKKQFKDFISYYKLCKYGVNLSDGETVKSYIPVIVCIFASMLFMLLQFHIQRVQSAGVFAFSIEIFYIVFLCGGAMNIGITTRNKPSMLGVAPFTPRQRVIFSYIAALVKATVVFVMCFAVMIFALFIAGCLISAVLGEFIFVVENDFSEVMVYSSRYTPAFNILLGVIFFFAYFAICNIDRAKYRNIAAVCFAVGMVILSTVFAYVCTPGAVIMDINDCLDSLKYPWVVFIVQGVLAVGAIVASVFATIRRFKSSRI